LTPFEQTTCHEQFVPVRQKQSCKPLSGEAISFPLFCSRFAGVRKLGTDRAEARNSKFQIPSSSETPSSKRRAWECYQTKTARQEIRRKWIFGKPQIGA
jgi:hypothetical protein